MFRYTAPELHDVFLGHHVEWGWVKGNLPQQPFSPQTSECGPEEFVQFNGKGPCVTAPWDNKVDNMISFNCDNLDTQEKRDKLWCVCNRPGREVGVLYPNLPSYS